MFEKQLNKQWKSLAEKNEKYAEGKIGDAVAKRTETPYIYPHEFLFLLCNSLNRLDTIKRLHKADFTSVKGDCY
jgi:hypothetical protein